MHWEKWDPPSFMQSSIVNDWSVLVELEIAGRIWRRLLIIFLQEVYCANEEKEQGPSNKNAQIMHHVDTTIEVVKDMIKELRIEVSDVSKQIGKNGPRKTASCSSEIMAQREAREWREKQDHQMKEVLHAIADLRKTQEMINRSLKRRQSSYSSTGEPDLLTVDSAASLKRGRKKKKRPEASLERSTSEPATEGTLKKKSKSRKSKEWFLVLCTVLCDRGMCETLTDLCFVSSESNRVWTNQAAIFVRLKKGNWMDHIEEETKTLCSKSLESLKLRLCLDHIQRELNKLCSNIGRLKENSSIHQRRVK